MRAAAAMVLAAEVGELPPLGSREQHLTRVRAVERGPGALDRRPDGRGSPASPRADAPVVRTAAPRRRGGRRARPPRETGRRRPTASRRAARRAAARSEPCRRGGRSRAARFDAATSVPGCARSVSASRATSRDGRLTVVGDDDDRVALEKALEPTRRARRAHRSRRRSARARRAPRRALRRARRSRSRRGRRGESRTRRG